jgi:Uma2 family endonuclease
MVAAASMPGLEPAPDEQRMLLHDVSWKEYVILRELIDRPGLRMTYLRGALELTSPSPEHELWKKNIARFIEFYAHLMNIDLYGYGSTTFKKRRRNAGPSPTSATSLTSNSLTFQRSCSR